MRLHQHTISFLKSGFLLLLICLPAGLPAQSIAIDRGVRAAGLWCFPLANDSTTWLYLPDRALLASDENKKPQFSFIRYVKPAAKASAEDATISTADGGAVLHFLVTYDTDPKKIPKAEEYLNEMFPGPAIKIRGPLIFKTGRYALVSSIINGDSGKEEKKLLSVGAAPVLEGSRIALSFEMTPERSKLLLESMQMSTPDVSIVFDMTFSGLMDAYKAKMTVDWSTVNKSRTMGIGFKIYYVGADLEDAYEELRRNGAILLEAEGEDEKMQQLVNQTYTKLTEIMFQAVEPEQLPEKDQGAISGLLDSLGIDNLTSGKIFPFGLNVVYKRKNIKTSGSSVLYFNSRSSTERHHFFTFNIGDFYKKYGQSGEYIRTVSLNRLDDQVRHIAVGIDGNLMPEFEKLINNVTVKLRKVHEDGSVTTDEVNITKQRLDRESVILLSYDAVRDRDPLAWMNYEYNAQFSFRGGRTWETGWQKQDMAMINLLTPYERRVIKLEADPALLKSKNVRATTIRVEYPFLGEKRTYEQTVMPDDDLSRKQFEITLPAGQYSYQYTLRWQLRDGTQRTFSGETDMGILFIDNVPGN